MLLLSTPKTSSMTDARLLFEYIHKEYESPAEFIRIKTGKGTREEFNSEYQFITQLLRKDKRFSEKNWVRLNKLLGVKKEDVKGVSGHNTIKGDNNNQATEGSTIQTGDSQLKERIISLEKEVKRLEELIEAKDELISLYKQRHN